MFWGWGEPYFTSAILSPFTSLRHVKNIQHPFFSTPPPPPPNDLQLFFSQLCWILISGSFHKLHFKVVPSMQWLHLRTAKINSSSNFIAFNVSLDIFQIFLHFLWTWLTRVSCILGICCCFIQQHSWYDFQFKIFQFLLKLQCLCNAYTGLHTLLNLLNIRCTPTLS